MTLRVSDLIGQSLMKLAYAKLLEFIYQTVFDPGDMKALPVFYVQVEPIFYIAGYAITSVGLCYYNMPYYNDAF